MSVYLPRNARALMRAKQLGGEIKYLRQGEIDARNRGYSPYSIETWRAWEYWANKAGCGELRHAPGRGEARGKDDGQESGEETPRGRPKRRRRTESHETRKLYRRRQARLRCRHRHGVITMNDRSAAAAASLNEALAGRCAGRDLEAAEGRRARSLARRHQVPAGRYRIPERSSASASTTSPMPPSTAPRRRSSRTSSPSSSTRCARTRARCCGRRCRPASTSRASSRW